MGTIKLPDEARRHFADNYEEIFDTGNLAEGQWNKSVAEWARDYTKAPFAHAVNSNGTGLFSILSILKHYRNKKRVFLQSNTMYGVRTIAITSGLDLCGYVGCELDSLMPSYAQVAEFIDHLDRPSEAVFLITHIGGWVNPEIEEIAKLCRERGISLVEDCAHSLGSTLNGEHTGLFGDAGVYSLYSTKAIPVGEGGIVVTRNEELHTMISKFSIYDRFDRKLDLGINNRMSELNALLAYSVLTQSEVIIENKKAIAKAYMDACDHYDWHYIHPNSNQQNSNLYKFILLSKAADPILEFSQIESRTSPVYDYTLGPDTHDIVNRHICLPIWYGLEKTVVDNVVSELIR